MKKVGSYFLSEYFRGFPNSFFSAEKRSKNGIARISLVMICSIVLFFGIYVTAECAGTRPSWFCISKIAASTAVSYIVSLVAVNILTSKDRQ